MSWSYKLENDSLIDLRETFCLLGRTTTEHNILLSIIVALKTDLQRRLKRFLRTESPYFFDTTSPRPGLEFEMYLKDKSLIFRDFDVFIMWENSDEERENFN